jgi:4-hydroxy-3-polyprenylbenzoate decarboxylase
MKTIIGITGATGIAFTLDFIKKLEGDKYFIVTKWGKELLRHEADMKVKDLEQWGRVFSDDDLTAPVSSGSAAFDAMAVLPCSAGTLNKVAMGFADSLLTRAAMVTLKERRKLILCLRETPLSTATLRNCAQLSADGAVVMPLMPPFYQKPLTMQDVLAGFSTRLLQVLGQPVAGIWKDEEMEGLD